MTNKVFFAPGLKLDFEEKSSETVVRCCGKITAAASEMFQREIKDNLIPESRGKLVAVNSRIVLDLSRVRYVDSAGLKAILALWTSGQNRCCDVEIINFTNGTRKVISTTGLDRMLARLRTLLHRGQDLA